MDQSKTVADLERRLEEIETRHRLLIEGWAQATWETDADADGVVVVDSPSWRAYTGQTLEEWLGFGWLDAIHPDDRTYAERQWREAVAALRLVNAEFRLRAPDGSWHWTNVRAAPVRDAGGTIEKWAGMNIDIDARKRAEEALLESERKYRTLFETMGQGYVEAEVVRDASGRAVDSRLIELNPAFERLTGVRVATARGRTNGEIFPGIEDWWAQTADRVVRGGVPDSVDYAVATLDRHYEVHFYPKAGDRYTAIYEDISDRKRAEKVLREREERQAFLLRLSDALRPIDDPVKIQCEASRILREHLGAIRVAYAKMLPDDRTCTLLAEDVVDPRFSLVGMVADWDAFDPVALAASRDGRIFARDDVQASGDLSPERKAAFERVTARAFISAPLIKAGRLVAFFVAHFDAPRIFSATDTAVMEETVERTWAAVERARAEEALRESEQRLREFGEASSEVLWIRSAETFQWEYLTPAFETIYGIDRPAALFGDDMANWINLIEPEDRELAIESLERVREGERVSFEYRIRRRSDGAVRWLRDTDFPMRDAAGRICWIGGVGRDITEEKASAQRQDVLVNELQHRARNLLGVVTAVAGRTLRQGGSVDAFEERLQALSRAQALLSQAGSDTVEVGALVRAELAAHTQDGSEQVHVAGPQVQLRARQVQNFALALHELTTNAVKYGALRNGIGRLGVTWEIVQDRRGRRRLALSWIESGVPVRPDAATRRGYGTELIQEALAYALDADVAYELGTDGVRCRIEMPIEQPE